MAKVVTSAGLNEFVQSGKVETMANDKPAQKAAEAPALEVKKEAPAVEVGVQQAAADTEDHSDDGMTDAERTELGESAGERAEKVRRQIGQKHRRMREAQEAAAEAERFAENQFNERRLLEAKAAQLEKELGELRSKAQPEAAKVPELKEPLETDPKYLDDKGQFKWKDYSSDLAEFKAKQTLAEYEQRQAQERSQAEAAKMAERFQVKITEAQAKYPDFQKVLEGTEANVPNAVLQYIFESDFGADIAYHLAKNPDVVARISKLPPIRAIAEVGKIETTFEKPATKGEPPPPAPKVSGAPPPITPISSLGSGTVNVDPSKMDYKQLRAYERERRKKR